MLLKKISKYLSKIYKPLKMEKQFQTTQFNLTDRPNFVKNEEDILAYWTKIKAFEQQLEKTKNNEPYTFYDGPPFATGKPHYGHICAGTIKDVITRYASMNGKYVERKFGWDCHGLPVEYEIDKKLGIKNRNEILDMGIDKYNQECRKIVMRYSSLWEDYVSRLGRWIDFKDDYKTMDFDFMQSVWWVFKQIFDKGLVYRGCKIMPYSTKCITVLSNFEASQKYQNVSDPAVVVTFPMIEDENVSFLAWTTTPWTLPSNLALCVNQEFTYVKVKDLKTGKLFILAKCRLGELFKTGKVYAECEAGTTQQKKVNLNQKKKKNKKKKKKKKGKNEEKKEIVIEKIAEDEKEFEILDEYKGKDLEGKEYKPLFTYYHEEMKKKGCFKIICGNFVTSDSGTGIVHTAPAFGEEDYKVCRKYNLINPEDPCISVDESGLFIDKITEFKGMYIKDADKLILERLKKEGRVQKLGTIMHNYPMCWRSGTPLIYKAVSTWFIKVTALKEQLLKNNLEARWVPKSAQTGRFQKWLENLNDWCFSRTRFWGNPIPIWASDDYEEIVCIGSVAELKELAGLGDDVEIKDLHMEFINDITIPSKKGKGVLRRIDETFDCWFESGSMPYASLKYPFKLSEEDFMKRFPADFIGEGLDQTRGWFYTLNVIGTALYDKCPYKNLIVNGIVCDSKGDKLSKSKGNFEDPIITVNEFGADPLRLYLMNSPLVKGQELKFSKRNLKAVVKDIFIPWYNLCRLLFQEINRYENKTKTKFVYREELFTEGNDFKFTNMMDMWVLAKTQHLINFIHQEFENYRLYTVLKEKLQYLDHLANWYVNLNKTRFKGQNGAEEANLSLNVFFYCFFSCIKMMAPYVPFIVEYFYQNMNKVIRDGSKLKEESIHFLRIPHTIKKFENENLVKSFDVFQNFISSTRYEKEKRNLSRKQPLSKIKISVRDNDLLENLKKLEDYIKLEVQVQEVEFCTDFEKYVKFSLNPNFNLLGQELGSKLSKVTPLIRKLNENQVKEFLTKKSLDLSFEYNDQTETITLDEERILIKSTIIAKTKNENLIIAGDIDFAYELNCEVTPELLRKGRAKEVVNRIQKSRKEGKVRISDPISIVLIIPEESKILEEVCREELDLIKELVKKPIFIANEWLISTNVFKNEAEVNGEKMIVEISLGGIQLNKEEFASMGEKGKKIRLSMMGFDPMKLINTNQVVLNIDGESVTLEKGKQFTL